MFGQYGSPWIISQNHTDLNSNELISSEYEKLCTYTAGFQKGNTTISESNAGQLNKQNFDNGGYHNDNNHLFPEFFDSQNFYQTYTNYPYVNAYTQSNDTFTSQFHNFSSFEIQNASTQYSTQHWSEKKDFYPNLAIPNSNLSYVVEKRSCFKNSAERNKTGPYDHSKKSSMFTNTPNQSSNQTDSHKIFNKIDSGLNHVENVTNIRPGNQTKNGHGTGQQIWVKNIETLNASLLSEIQHHEYLEKQNSTENLDHLNSHGLHVSQTTAYSRHGNYVQFQSLANSTVQLENLYQVDLNVGCNEPGAPYRSTLLHTDKKADSVFKSDVAPPLHKNNEQTRHFNYSLPKTNEITSNWSHQNLNIAEVHHEKSFGMTNLYSNVLNANTGSSLVESVKVNCNRPGDNVSQFWREDATSTEYIGVHHNRESNYSFSNLLPQAIQGKPTSDSIFATEGFEKRGNLKIVTVSSSHEDCELKKNSESIGPSQDRQGASSDRNDFSQVESIYWDNKPTDNVNDSLIQIPCLDKVSAKEILIDKLNNNQKSGLVQMTLTDNSLNSPRATCSMITSVESIKPVFFDTDLQIQNDRLEGNSFCTSKERKFINSEVTEVNCENSARRIGKSGNSDRSKLHNLQSDLKRRKIKFSKARKKRYRQSGKCKINREKLGLLIEFVRGDSVQIQPPENDESIHGSKANNNRNLEWKTTSSPCLRYSEKTKSMEGAYGEKLKEPNRKCQKERKLQSCRNASSVSKKNKIENENGGLLGTKKSGVNNQKEPSRMWKRDDVFVGNMKESGAFSKLNIKDIFTKSTHNKKEIKDPNADRLDKNERTIRELQCVDFYKCSRCFKIVPSKKIWFNIKTKNLNCSLCLSSNCKEWVGDSESKRKLLKENQELKRENLALKQKIESWSEKIKT